MIPHNHMQSGTDGGAPKLPNDKTVASSDVGRDDPAQDLSTVSASSTRRELAEARLEELKSIAKSIALDSTLEVKLGEEGQGSFCHYGLVGVLISARERSITMDPKHIHDPSGDFIVAHEGMHARNTFSPYQRDLHRAMSTTTNIDQLYQEVGFASLFNFLEDCGGNSWLLRAYPGFQGSCKAFYDGMLLGENPTMVAGEVSAVWAQIGFYPRYAQFGAEVMKKWWTGSYSKQVDPDVAAALKLHESDVESFMQSFPEGQAVGLVDRQVKFVDRFLLTALRIYPTLKKLVEKDLGQAAKQQMLQRQQQGQQDKQGEQNQQGQQGQQGQQDQQGQQGQQPAQDKAGQAGSPYSDKVQREIEKQSEKFREERRKDLSKQLDDLNRALGNQEQADKDSAQSRSGAAKAIDELRSDIDRKMSGDDKAGQREKLQKRLDELEKLNNSIDSQAGPIDKLSKEAQEEIDKAFNSQSTGEKSEDRESAEILLKRLEDALRKTLESELNDEDAPPMHEKQEEGAEQQRQVQKRSDQIQRDIERMEEDRRAKLGDWDKLRAEVNPLIQGLYSKLERILRPVQPEFEDGYSSGNKVNISGAMQAQADPRYLGTMWERKTLPLEKSHVFSLLVDVSGSMSVGDTNKYAAGCAVLLSEVLTRLNVPFEIAWFGSSSGVVKKCDQSRLNKAEKNKVAGVLTTTNGGTNDYTAVAERVKSLSQRDENYKFLIVMTDGGSENPVILKSNLEEALIKGIQVIGIGIGTGTREVSKNYPIGRGELTLDPKDRKDGLGPYFTKTLEAMLLDPESFVRRALNKR